MFASLHETDENQSDEDSSASSDEEEEEERTQATKDTSKFLKSIGLEALIPLFEARSMDIEQLQSISAEELSEVMGS